MNSWLRAEDSPAPEGRIVIWDQGELAGDRARAWGQVAHATIQELFMLGHEMEALADRCPDSETASHLRAAAGSCDHMIRGLWRSAFADPGEGTRQS